MKERAKKALQTAFRVILIYTFVIYLAKGVLSCLRIGVYLLATFAVAYILKGWRDEMPTRAKVLAVIMIIGILFGVRFVSAGLSRRSDQVLWHYSVSEDGSVITVDRMDALPSSVGWVRSMKTEYYGKSIYCYFYNTFGGNLSKLGAKYSFDIKLKEDSTKIYFQSGGGKSRLVLQKDEETNTWVACDPW